MTKYLFVAFAIIAIGSVSVDLNAAPPKKKKAETKENAPAKEISPVAVTESKESNDMAHVCTAVCAKDGSDCPHHAKDMTHACTAECAKDGSGCPHHAKGKDAKCGDDCKGCADKKK